MTDLESEILSALRDAGAAMTLREIKARLADAGAGTPDHFAVRDAVWGLIEAGTLDLTPARHVFIVDRR